MSEHPGTADRDGRIVTFYSYKGGTGRTMAVANVAWILASNGYRVLAVDWDLEAPGLDLFFQPFLEQNELALSTGVIDLITDYRKEALRGGERTPAWTAHLSRVRPRAVPISWDRFADGGSLDFLSAGRTSSNYSATLGGIDWVSFYEDLGGGDFFQALRADMRRSYDYVLIDSRTGLSDSAEICTVDMPDDLVVCFTLTNQSIEGASRVANLIADQYSDRQIRILPVPMRVDKGEREKVSAGKNYARAKFGSLPRGRSAESLTRYWNSIEIPYQPYYAFEEILAAFGDEPGLPATLLAAFERLTAELTEGRVTALAPLGSDVRLDYAEAFHRWLPDPLSPAGGILVSHAAEDTAWAEWIAYVLRKAGHQVWTADVSTEPDPWQGGEPSGSRVFRTVAVLSASYVRSPGARALWDSVTRRDPQGKGRRLIPIAIAELTSPAPFNNRTEANISRVGEAEAIEVVLEAVGGAAGQEEAPDGADPRFPGTQPEIWNLANRNRIFTGRADLLQRLRAGFDRGAVLALQPQVLFGLSGVGKTQVALEYAYRFMSYYDLVWWIDAEHPDRVAASLGELAARLGLSAGESVADAARAACYALNAGRPVDRWLLIFDNADDPEVARYFPARTGHILVTSRSEFWFYKGKPQEVDVFIREESIEHLRRQVSSLSWEDANRLAEAVGDLPLAVGTAADWLGTTGTPVDTYVAQLTTTAQDDPTVPVNPDRPRALGGGWDILLRRLKEQSPSVGRLLEIAAYFAPHEIPGELLQSDRMVEALELSGPVLRGQALVRAAIESIGRYRLAEVGPDSSIRLRRTVRALLRSSLSPEDRTATKHVVHDILVAARPPVDDVGDPEFWPAFERIWPHLASSGAVDCDADGTRKLLLDRVRYLWMRGELEAGESLARELQMTWLRKYASEDRLALYLRSQLANVLRSEGRIQECWRLDRDTLAKQQELLGPNDLDSLISTRALAADLRALGRFGEALELDRALVGTMSGLQDEAQTLFTLNNLAIDYRCIGDYQRARDLDQETLERKIACLGPGHPFTLTGKAALAEDLRALGDYQGSLTQLEEFREQYGSVPVMDLPSLRYAASLAVTLRQLGRPEEARNISAATYERLRRIYGEHAPDTLSCALNLAADYSAAGESERARDFAVEVRDGYRERVGADHPFVFVCEVNITIYQRDSGQVGEAIQLGERAAASLEQRLGSDHPFTLSARLNLANSYGVAGDALSAAELGRAVLSGLSARYGAKHPDAVICAANVSVALRESGQESQAEELHSQAVEELVAQLGPEHPLTLACGRWQRVGRPLEIPPL